MSASLTIHIAPSEIVEDVKEFLRKTSWNSIKGNCAEEWLINGEWKHIDDVSLNEIDSVQDFRRVPLRYDEDAVYNAPGTYIGEVSWMKAAIFENSERYIPTTVELISALVGKNLPEITDEFIDEVRKAFDEPNTTSYGLADRDTVIAFLAEHKGSRVFQM